MRNCQPVREGVIVTLIDCGPIDGSFHRRVRAMLKRALRSHQLRCDAIRPLSSPTTPEATKDSRQGLQPRQTDD